MISLLKKQLKITTPCYLKSQHQSQVSNVTVIAPGYLLEEKIEFWKRLLFYAVWF